MGKKTLIILSIILLLVSIASVLFIGFRYDFFNHPNRTYTVMAFIIPLIQLSIVFIARFKK